MKHICITRILIYRDQKIIEKYILETPDFRGVEAFHSTEIAEIH